MAAPFLACMAVAAQYYALPPRVLPSIQRVEGGRVGLVHANTDGSEDLGVMQINTRWVVPLSRYTRLPVTAVRARLLHNACFNIAAAGAVLRGYLNEAHGDLLLAVGYYHSHTRALNLSYRQRVLDAATAMFARGAGGRSAD